MALVLNLDTECNSLDTTGGFIMELAWGIYSTEHKRFLNCTSNLLHWPRPYSVDPDAEKITGLSYNFCQEHGRSATIVLEELVSMIPRVDFVCGHNILGYDKPMISSNIKRLLFAYADVFEQAKFIDTLIDCPFPKKMRQHSLKYLALDHGYVLTGAHQALNDVYACAHILSCYDFDIVQKIAATPLVTLTSKIDWNELEKRDKLKNMRFYWSPTKKLWEKKIREFHLPGIQLELGFSVDKILG